MMNPRRVLPAVLCRSAFALAVSVFFSAPVKSQDTEPAERGIFITVANPITSEVVNGIRGRIALAQRDKPLSKIVFDFNPDGREAGSVDYGPCLDLANAISEMRPDDRLRPRADPASYGAAGPGLPGTRNVLGCHVGAGGDRSKTPH